jgi:hypothetical protein
VRGLSSSQGNRECLVDKKNKGGKSLVMRCANFMKDTSDCGFYAKLRKSSKDEKWYICSGVHPLHTCEMPVIQPKFSSMNTEDVHNLLIGIPELISEHDSLPACSVPTIKERIPE